MQRNLSLIIPAYNEEKSLKPLYAEIEKSLHGLIKDQLISDYEIWFIADGCTDNSEKIIEQLIKKNSKIKLISFRRNFGKSKALQVGFSKAQGDLVITLDADMQDDPKEFKRLINKIDEGYDLVSGWKYNRLDPVEKRWPSKFFNYVTAKFSGLPLHDFNCGFKAYRKEVVKNINLYGEFHRYIPILAMRSGFNVTEIAVNHHKRQFGDSKFGKERYLRGLFDAMSALFLLKYWDKPMYFFGKLGLIFGLLGVSICFYLSCLWFGGEAIGGRPLLILGVLFILVGIQSVSMGLITNIIVDMADKKRDNQAIIKKIIDERADYHEV